MSDKERAAFAAYGDAIIDYCADHDCPLMTVYDERNEAVLYQYGNGIWREIDNLDPMIAHAAEGHMDMPARTFKEVNHFIRTRHRIAQRDVIFDAHGSVACANGLLDPHTMELRPYTPDDYATRKGPVAFVPGALSPLFDAFLAGCMEDKPAEDAKALSGLLQEWWGASLALPLMPREARKALLVLGGTRTGKTEIAEIFRKVIGGNVASSSIDDVSKNFGLEQLYGATAWVCDDAINEGDALNPQRFKVIVTGEAVDVPRKGVKAVRAHRFNLPVMLTTNTLAKAKDSSDAVINRSLIVRFNRTFSEKEAASLRKQMGIKTGVSLADYIFKAEASGILNWALEGLLRVMDRGYFEIPELVNRDLTDFKNENNPIAEWAGLALVKNPDYRIARADLLCCFHGFQRETDGGNVRAWGGRYVFPKLRTVLGELNESKSTGERYVNGIKLTATGLEWFKQHNQRPLPGGSEGVTKGDMDPSKHVSKF
jgi:P4 family phage/plasmid primase-like protien